MQQHRITLTLSEAALDALSRTGNQSAYVARCVEMRWAIWQQALGHLLSSRWTQDEIVSALDSLNGACSVERGLYGVARAMLQSVRRNIPEGELAACLTLAEEWWTGNAELRRVLLTPDMQPRSIRGKRKRGRPQPQPLPPLEVPA